MEESPGNQAGSPFLGALCHFPYSSSFPQDLHHTLTHNLCTDEQTKKNSHQPEPALWEETDAQVKTGCCPAGPQDLP